MLREKIDAELTRLVNFLKKSQSAEGTWNFCFETGPLTDAYMIILLRTLEMDDEILIRSLAERIASRQEENGAWKLYHDEADGNLSATVEAYVGLLYSGYRQKNDEAMQAAHRFIAERGGFEACAVHTKIMLAVIGAIPWPSFFLPVELILLPRFFPINFFDFVGYSRVHLAPTLILSDRKFLRKVKQTPDLTELNLAKSPGSTSREQRQTEADQELPLFKLIKQLENSVGFLPKQVHKLALRKAERFMLERIEPDGTLYSYFSATFQMSLALLGLGYSTNDPVISKAVRGLKTLLCQTGEQIHLQNSTSTVWDTALICHALQTAGHASASPEIEKANRYLLSRQQHQYGDWALNNPGVLPGCWGFSNINTRNPDVDDTTAALRAIKRMAETDEAFGQAWRLGLKWILSMQNNDGGWSSFEKNTDKEILNWLPMEGADAVNIDPSTADLTGRTLEFLGRHAGLTMDNRQITRGVEWLMKNQQADGSWYGRWGICYLYGTWAALTGMTAVGLPAGNLSVRKAVDWLNAIQNQDGGWGESCKSDIGKKYMPLGASTPSQTAWALDALIAAAAEPTPAMERAVSYLVSQADHHDWRSTYPTGAGLPGGFYIHYHSYRYIWPLIALGNYRQKYGVDG